MEQFFSDDDQKLSTRKFRIKEPQKLPGLTLRVARSAKARRILYWYDETPPGGEKAGHKKHIVCAFGHPHWKGFVVELIDGRIILVGRHCACRDFGADFADVINRFDAIADRQIELRRLAAMAAAFPDAILELRALKFTGAVLGFGTYWSLFTRHCGDLHSQLRNCLKANAGLLVKYDSVRDDVAEEGFAKGIRPELFKAYDKSVNPDRRQALAFEIRKFINDGPRRYKTVITDMGRCESWDLIVDLNPPTPKYFISEAVSIAERLRLSRASSEWTKQELAKLRRDIDQMFDKINRARTLVGGLNKFTTESNISLVARWAQAHGFEARAERRAIVCDVRIELPPDYGWPETPKLALLKDARDFANDSKLNDQFIAAAEHPAND